VTLHVNFLYGVPALGLQSDSARKDDNTNCKATETVPQARPTPAGVNESL